MSFTPADIYFLVMIFPAIVLSLTVHEYAHARTALAFGDETAKLMGRCSFNPLRHLDPVGTLLMLLTQGLGWAKPVPVNQANLNPPRLGDIMVSFAGPFSNLLLAALTALVVRLLLHYGLTDPTPKIHLLYQVLLITIQINVACAFFNLLPLFPLDGHHIARELLPADRRVPFMQWQTRSGWVVLLALVMGPRLLGMLLHRPIFDPVHEGILSLLIATVRLFHLAPALPLAFPN